MKLRSKNITYASAALRKAFSLIELMIVLAVMVVIAAMAMPNMMESIREGEVHKAAELVRETLSEARKFAIDSGIDYQFRYEVNGQSFVVIPTEVEPTTANSIVGSGDTGHYFRLVGELDPAFSMLVAGEGAVDTTESLESVWFGDLSGAGNLATKSWSAPIYFRFDGTATDALFKVVDEDRRTAELRVRGLTGSVRLSPVYTEAKQ
jgi:prepilin-type N-terminal cleavage/methylation domain-containing protein